MAGEFDFGGRTALITGAASGIGAATAQWLDRHGAAELILIDLDRPTLDKLELGCKAQRIGGDVADPSLWTLIAPELGSLDHAVINAGVASSAAIVDLDISHWRKLMASNLDGAFLALRCALRAMRRHGSGSVVLTASVSGLKAEPGTAAYGASKAAVLQLARIAARESAEAGIRVNAIAPGGVDTPIWDRVTYFQQLVAEHGDRAAAMSDMARMATPLGRYATADEIAAQIGFLLSPLAATITGTVLVSDGGYSL